MGLTYAMTLTDAFSIAHESSKDRDQRYPYLLLRENQDDVIRLVRLRSRLTRSVFGAAVVASRRF